MLAAGPLNYTQHDYYSVYVGLDIFCSEDWSLYVVVLGSSYPQYINY